jgi:Fe-S-cluster containining protein
MKGIIQSFLPRKEREASEAVVGKYYRRTGSCNMCGKCCKDIYLIHHDRTIESIEEFETLKPDNPEYQHFIPVQTTPDGVQFQCKHLSSENRCQIYANRPDFCRKYPSEKTLLLGGQLAKGCGFQFELLKTFDEVLSKVADKKNLKAGRLDE